MPDGLAWLDVKEASAISGFHPKAILRLLRTGKVPGHKFNGRWRVGRMALLYYLETDDIRFDPKHHDAPFRRDEALRAP